jgi:hypothetical protein
MTCLVQGTQDCRRINVFAELHDLAILYGEDVDPEALIFVAAGSCSGRARDR